MSFLGIGSQPQPQYPPPNYPEHSGMYAAWEQEDLTGIVGVTLDNSSLLVALESYLSGKVLVDKTDAQTGKKVKVWVEASPPLMNDEGVRAVIMKVRLFLDKNTIMSFYPSMEELDSMWLAWGEEFGIFLALNSQKFNIDTNQRASIALDVCKSVRETMQRSLNGNEKQGVYKMSKRIENAQVQQTAQSSGSVFGSMPKI